MTLVLAGKKMVENKELKEAISDPGRFETGGRGRVILVCTRQVVLQTLKGNIEPNLIMRKEK
uniref:Uncharacterized protein n=1 Tax=Strigamia maritima TaxID=126957 RepID=T1IGV1_STRMM